MADFQAAIDNIVVTETLITIEDTSNYTTSTQAGHQEINFELYRKFIMTTPSRTFTYSSQGDGDQITSGGDGGVFNFNFSLDDEDIDGVYDFTLYTAPNYDNIYTYNRNDCVFLDIDGGIGLLYKSKINGNLNNTPSTSNQWEQIDESLLTSRYCVTDSVIITDRQLLPCYEKLVADAVCELENDLCGDMCNNKDFMDAMKMRLLIDAICIAASNNDFNGARKKFNLVNRLC